MNKLTVILIEDERDILSNLAYEMSELEDFIETEKFESGHSFIKAIPSLKHHPIALIITDHLMPGLKGTEVLQWIKSEPTFAATRTILLTGQATHQDTIEAINSRRLDYYIAKPWDKEDLLNVSRTLLAEFLLEKNLDAGPFLPYLDHPGLVAQSIKNLPSD